MSSTKRISSQKERSFRGGRNVPSVAALQKEVVACSKPYARFLQADFELEPDQPLPDWYWQKRRKALIEALDLALDSYQKQLIKQQLTEEVLPSDMARLLRDALMDAANGDPHPLFTPARVPGGRGNRNPRRADLLIDRGVDYLTAVEAGVIADGAPVKTVSETFGVSPRQIRRWRTQRGSLRHRQKAMAARIRDFQGGPKSVNNPHIITGLMKFAGEEYQERRPRRRA